MEDGQYGACSASVREAVAVSGGRVLGRPTGEQARIRLQVTSARPRSSHFPSIEGDAGYPEDIGYFLLSEAVSLAESRTNLRWRQDVRPYKQSIDRVQQLRHRSPSSSVS